MPKHRTLEDALDAVAETTACGNLFPMGAFSGCRRPWTSGSQSGVALTEGGCAAMLQVLRLHGCVPDAAAKERPNDRASCLQLERGAVEFIEEHVVPDSQLGGPSCVPGVSAGALVVMMGLFGMGAERRAAALAALPGKQRAMRRMLAESNIGRLPQQEGERIRKFCYILARTRLDFDSATLCWILGDWVKKEIYEWVEANSRAEAQRQAQTEAGKAAFYEGLKGRFGITDEEPGLLKVAQAHLCCHGLPAAADCDACSAAGLGRSYDPEVYRTEVRKALSHARGILLYPTRPEGEGQKDYQDFRQACDLEVWLAARRYGSRMNAKLAYAVARNVAGKRLKQMLEYSTVVVNEVRLARYERWVGAGEEPQYAGGEGGRVKSTDAKLAGAEGMDDCGFAIPAAQGDGPGVQPFKFEGILVGLIDSEEKRQKALAIVRSWPPRQKRVAEAVLAGDGRSNTDLAKELGISRREFQRVLIVVKTRLWAALGKK